MHGIPPILQTGTVIIQQNQPVTYRPCELTATQQNYHTMEMELLSIIMVLEEFHSMHLGDELFKYTSHRNLTLSILTVAA